MVRSRGRGDTSKGRGEPSRGRCKGSLPLAMKKEKAIAGRVPEPTEPSEYVPSRESPKGNSVQEHPDAQSQ